MEVMMTIPTRIARAKKQVIVQGIFFVEIYIFSTKIIAYLFLDFRVRREEEGRNTKSLLYWMALRSRNCFLAFAFVVHLAKTRFDFGFETR
jgi:hypothetical protein